MKEYPYVINGKVKIACTNGNEVVGERTATDVEAKIRDPNIIQYKGDWKGLLDIFRAWESTRRVMRDPVPSPGGGNHAEKRG